MSWMRAVAELVWKLKIFAAAPPHKEKAPAETLPGPR